MPPHVTRKRLRADTTTEEKPVATTRKTRAPRVIKTEEKAVAEPPAKKRSIANLKATPTKRKPTLYDSLDAPPAADSAGELSPAQLLSLKSGKSESEEGGSDEDSDSDEDEFEDVIMETAKMEDTPVVTTAASESGSGSEDDSDDDPNDLDNLHIPLPDFTNDEAPSGDMELTLVRDPRISLMNSQKKGPTKRARQARVLTHCMHVQFLLFHNTVRNGWACDLEVQALLLSHVPPRLLEQIEQWRGKFSGERTKWLMEEKKRKTDVETPRQEKVDQARKFLDPMYRVFELLMPWWRQRFRVTRPGLRKRGYMELDRIDRLEKGWAENRVDDGTFGERIENIEGFRECAARLKGSRDIGGQLFTALVRALGFEARLVCNLQVLGYGWNKLEEADPETEVKEEVKKEVESAPKTTKKTVKPRKPPVRKPAAKKQATQPTKKNPSRKAKEVIADSEDSSSLSSIEDSDSEDDDLTMELSDSDADSVADVDVSNIREPVQRSSKIDGDLDIPIYWTEVLSPVTGRYIPLDATVKNLIGSTPQLANMLEPRGSKHDKARLIIGYVVGHNSDGTAKDVTVRYLRDNVFPGRTKGVRLGVEKIAIRNRRGKIKRYEEYDWFSKVMSCFVRTNSGTRPHRTAADKYEDSTDLVPITPPKKAVKEGEETLAYYKASTEYVLVRHLKREEALVTDAAPVKEFKTKTKGKVSSEPVYRRTDVVSVKSAETWHKQGRAPIPGEAPLKYAPYRAATNNRRKELAEAEARTGTKPMQGLFSLAQTEWIIPDPIENGVIPKNSYGNIDLFAAHMCPKGAIHVPYRGAVRACKKLGFDYAEAVVDFEFGHRMAVPVIQGVVCAEEYYEDVLEQIKIDEEERQRREDEKRKKAALTGWRKFLKGLRIIERVRKDYGGVMEGFQVFGKSHRRPEDVVKELIEQRGEEGGGGFIPEGCEVDEPESKMEATSGFFPVVDENDDGDGGLEIVVGDEEGGFMVEEAEEGGFEKEVPDEPETESPVKLDEIPDSESSGLSDVDSEYAP